MNKTDTTKTGTTEKPDPWRVPVAVAQIPDTGLHRKHLAQASDIGHRVADSLIGLDVAMQARLRYLRHCDGDAPRVGLLCGVALAHCCAPFSGKGNLAEPLASAASSRLSRAAIAASA